MSFQNLSHSIYIILFFIFFYWLVTTRTKKFFNWVKDHWFYKRSLLNSVSTFLFLGAVLLMLISLMDLRGKPENIETDMGPDKTVLLIDVSTSMMVEDVRPSRFKKALLFARHFVKHAAGKEVSVILFSDSQKKLVPFTTDIDLVATRLNSLEDYRIQGGGTSISKALLSTINYMRDSKGKATGNIILITDAEENEAVVDFKFPEDISLAVVGVGTSKGGRIPIKGSNGAIISYKRYQNEFIVSKLNEKAIRGMGNGISNFNYWILQSYSLPTEEILKFLGKTRSKIKQRKKAVVREVKAHLLLIPACLLFLLSLILKNFRPVYLPVLLLMIISSPSYAQDMEEEKKLTPEQIEALEKIEDIKYEISDGDYHFSDKLKLAFQFLKLKEGKKALTLYKEVLGRKDIKVAVGTYINFATAKAMNNDLDGALKDYFSLYEGLKKVEGSEGLREVIKKNTLTLIMTQNQQQKSKQNKQDQNKDKNQDQDNKDQQNQGESSQDQKQKSKDSKSGKDKNKEKDSEKPFEMDNEKKQKEQDKKNKQNGDKNKKEKKKKKTKSGKGKEKKKKKPGKKKLDARLKQLLDADKKTQGDLLNPRIKGKSDTGKEW